MRVNFTKLGAAMLGVSPVLVNLIPNKVGWWIGAVFTVLGPFVMCLQADPAKKQKQPEQQEVEHEEET